MVTVSVLVLVVILLAVVLLALASVPLLLIASLLPWLLSAAGVILLLKALFQTPYRWENYLPAVSAFVLSGVIRWLF